MASSPKPDCMRCRHFFITWHGEFPRGCRAYGFRSPEVPSVVVLRESGIPCQLFEKHRRRGGTGDKEREGRLVH
ncbi:MAG: uracil-DNA glycosylase [Myxococcota bacterium]|jgi:hypothetical protein|nr:uracil-DNA glycosylase [Myxococcota bacterium]